VQFGEANAFVDAVERFGGMTIFAPPGNTMNVSAQHCSHLSLAWTKRSWIGTFERLGLGLVPSFL
jgi:hypothetical protein